MAELRIIGLTGPTGAGKSSVCSILQQVGCGIIDTDRLARQITEPGHPCLQQLAAVFPGILQGDGSLDRAALARQAFSDPAQEQQLNAITHPAIIALTETALAEMAAEGKSAAVIDAPLLYESGLDGRCDIVLAVLAPESVRLQRLQRRDGLPETDLRRRMQAQPPAAFYTQRAALTLTNTGDTAALETAVRALLPQLMGETQ